MRRRQGDQQICFLWLSSGQLQHILYLNLTELFKHFNSVHKNIGFNIEPECYNEISFWEHVSSDTIRTAQFNDLHTGKLRGMTNTFTLAALPPSE